MKRILLFTVLILIVILSASCDKSEQGELVYARFTAEPDLISGLGATITLNVESNTEWTLSKQNTDTWFHVTPSSGRGNQELTIVIDVHTDLLNSRTGKLTVHGGAESTSINITQSHLLLPAAAGNIEGKELGEVGEAITLSIPVIANAQQYNWYRNGALTSTTDIPSLDIYLGGNYTVKGINPMGVGAMSAVKEVRYNQNYHFDTVVQAIYEGGSSYTYYVVELKKVIDEETEIYAWFQLGEDAPTDPNNILLPARDYVALEPYQNNYTGKGIVYPATLYTVTENLYNTGAKSGRVYIKRRGEILNGSEMFFKCTADNKISVSRDEKHYSISGELACVQPVMGAYDDGSTYVKELIDCGSITMNFEGQMTFKDVSHDNYNTFYYNLGDSFNRNIELDALSARILYSSKNPGEWFFEMNQGSSYTEPGWRVLNYFYSNNPINPVGTYTLSNNPQLITLGTMPRGYFYNDSYGGLHASYYTDDSNRDRLVLAQPNINSYLKIEKTGDETYKMKLVMYDMEGNKFSMTFDGTPYIAEAVDEESTQH